MGALVRESLRRLCAEGEWSYAVFWRAVECGNSRQLVWGEGHCEPSRTSAVSDIPDVGSANSLLEEWGVATNAFADGHIGELRRQADERICGLVENTMKPQVHVVGYGIIGSAAFTGNHRWIVHNARLGEGYITEGLVEINSHLLAGIQTVAVMPALPHGVVQLGSIQMIREDVRFVSRVRSLFVQLGCVPGAFTSDNTLTACHSVQGGSASLPKNNVDHQNSKIRSSGHVVLPCSSASFISDSRPYMSAQVLLNSKPITTMPIYVNEFSNQKAHSVASPVIPPQCGKQQVRSVGKQVPSDNGIILNQQLVPCKMKSENHSQFSQVKSALSSSAFIEQQLSGFVLESDKNTHGLDNHMPLRQSLHGYQLPTYLNKDAGTMQFPGRRELLKTAGVPGILSPSGSTWAESSIGYEIACSSCTETLRPVDSSNKLDNKSVLSEVISAHYMTTSDNRTLGECKIEDEVLRTHINSCATSVEHVSSTCSEISAPYYYHWKSGNSEQGGKERKNGAFDQKVASNSTLEKEHNADASNFFRSALTMSDNLSELSIVHPSGNDLFDALGLDYKSRQPTGNLDSLFAGVCNAGTWESRTDVSACTSHLDGSIDFDDAPSGISGTEVFADMRHDQLLDAVVSKVNLGSRQTFSDNAFPRTTKNTIGNSFQDNSSKDSVPTLSGQLQPELFGISPALQTGFGSSSIKSSCSVAESGDCFRREGYKSQISIWAENDRNIKIDNASSACKKVDEMGKSNRKRPKPGENPRPRPKDRQMIQDRVKELREIVPNGAKLSIDALLERTIKHMLFLQSVTKHADKLKEIGEPKIISKEGGLLLKDNFEGGATWAFEVGSQSMICPIIVEDLNPPRQLLVEMLCEERGFFLEIADLIKGLGLTILKGVMEARNDKVWARFAVESNSDVTRMDIFLALVQLLEPRAVTSVPHQGFDSVDVANNMMCQFIPATGVTNLLQ